jgi:hypothetical protein
LARRSRKRGRRAVQRQPRAGRPAGPPAPSPSRTEERNAAVRATLKPLAPGERPWPLKVAALLAVLVGAGDLLQLVFAGTLDIGGTKTSSPGVVFFAVLMLVCAVGMWQQRYWAVLGFQAILAFVILIFSLLLIRASNLLGFVVAIAIVGGCGFLFYKLVRVLSRLQIPQPPSR